MQIITIFEKAANRIIKINPWTNVYGLARTLLALGTCVTLLFNDLHDMVPTVDNTPIFQPHSNLQKISIFYLLNYENIKISSFICILILLIVAIGWRPQITGVLHFWVCFSVMSSIPLIDGGDQIANNISLLLIPVTLFDSRKWHWQNIDKENTRSNYFNDIKLLFSHSCVWMIRLQIAIIYFDSAIAKLAVPEWVNGTALYYWWGHNIFGMPLFIRPFLMPILSHSLPVVLLTWAVILFEILLFVAFFLPKRQWRYFLTTGILFHLSIWFIHGLCSFFFTMAAGLIIYLRPVERTFKWIDRLLTPIRKVTFLAYKERKLKVAKKIG